MGQKPLLSFDPESKVVVVTWFWARSLRYSVLVRVAMAINFSHLWAAFSALITEKSKHIILKHCPFILCCDTVWVAAFPIRFLKFYISRRVQAYFWQEGIPQTGLILGTLHFLGYEDQMEGHLLTLWRQYWKENQAHYSDKTHSKTILTKSIHQLTKQIVSFVYINLKLLCLEWP